MFKSEPEYQFPY